MEMGLWSACERSISPTNLAARPQSWHTSTARRGACKLLFGALWFWRAVRNLVNPYRHAREEISSDLAGRLRLIIFALQAMSDGGGSLVGCFMRAEQGRGFQRVGRWGMPFSAVGTVASVLLLLITNRFRVNRDRKPCV